MNKNGYNNCFNLGIRYNKNKIHPANSAKCLPANVQISIAILGTSCPIPPLGQTYQEVTDSRLQSHDIRTDMSKAPEKTMAEIALLTLLHNIWMLVPKLGQLSPRLVKQQPDIV
eukprot:g28834.t1